MQTVWTRSSDDIDNIFQPTPDWDFELRQMSCGRLGYRAAIIALDDVNILWETSDQALRSLQVKRHAGFTAAAALGSPRPPKWNGQTLTPDKMLIFGAAENDMLLPDGGAWLSLTIAPRLAFDTGLAFLPPGLWSTQADALGNLLARCRDLYQRFAAADMLAPARSPPPGRGAAGRSIARALMACLDTPVPLGAHPHHRIVRDAEAMLERCGWDGPPAIDDLADALGVSRRTMHRAFNEVLGRAPASYIRLVQLHMFHQRLKDCDNYDSVTRAAAESGFDHFGRAARYYRDHFGHLPRETRQMVLTA